MRSMHIKRMLIVSCATILACMSVVAGMTWALFTDTQIVTNHLVAGDLVIKLSRTELTKTTLDTTTGYLKTEAVPNAALDFTDPSDANVFGLSQDEKMVPGTKYVATMEVSADAEENDVAFEYWVRIDCKDDNALAEQLYVTVRSDVDGDGDLDVVIEGNLVNDLGSLTNPEIIGTVSKGNPSTFVVEVEFENLGYTYENGILSSTNNDAKGQDVDFDLIVYAVQVQYEETTTETETETETEPANVE